MGQALGQVATLAPGTAVGRAGQRLSWSVAWSAVVLAAAALVLAVLAAARGGDPRSLLTHQLLLPFSAAGFAFIGGLVSARRPSNPIGWICLATALMQAVVANAGYASVGRIGGSALVDFTTWLGLWLWVPAIFLPTFFVFMLFPDGRLPSRAWRPSALAGALGVAAIATGLAFLPGPLPQWATPANPYGVPSLAALLGIVLSAGTVLAGVAVVTAAIGLVVRFRGARGTLRRQLKWLVYVAALLLTTFLASGIVASMFPDSRVANELSIVATNLAVLGIAAAAGIAILYHRLYDIDVIINRTLVYLALTGAVAALYIIAVGGTGMLVGGEDNFVGAILATGLVAVLFQPLRARLQRGVNRLLYGQRDEPIAVLEALGQRLEHTTELDLVPMTLVRTVAETLKLPYVSLALAEPDGLRVAAEFGRPVTDTVTLPLVYQHQEIGELRVAPRDHRGSLDPADRALLETVVRQAGVAMRSVQLTRDLRRSHHDLVTSQEEERRRLRRDLHDGLGPALASLTLGLDAARNLIDSQPEAVSPLLLEMRQQVQAVIKDIRRLVYDLRPPALDDLGLVAALQEQARQYEQQGQKVDVQATGSLFAQPAAPLPAAVEVAAYRIVQEALTNVVRHSAARACSVKLTATDELRITIEDDGTGMPITIRPGVGLTSMRERANAVGGEFQIGAGTNGGTTIVVNLPLQAEL